jgi:hypothetical protein
MPATRTRPALAALALVGVMLPGTALAQTVGAAQAPDVGPQKTLTAGKKAPTTIPGTGLKKGMTIKKGTKLVSRTVAVSDGETVRFTLSCGKARTVLRGIGMAEGGKAIVNLDGRGSYLGKRTVTLKADAPRSSPDARTTAYALCAR